LITDVVDIAAIPEKYRKHDLQGRCIAPSFIDLQIYGGNGKLFSHEVTVEALDATYAYCRSGGAAHFMITIATNSREKVTRGIQAVRDYWSAGRKGLLGLHLEGPYINPVKKGAHVERFITKPVLAAVQTLLEEGKGVIKMMTLAPECCDDEIIRLLLNEGILVSAGHSNATYAESQKGFNLGIKTATHLFNAMSPFQSREPGLVGAIYDHGKVMSSVICDGIHVDYAAVRISKKMMGERLFFITDAVTATTAGEYTHVFKDDHYTLPGGTLSGSALTMASSIKNAIMHVGIPIEEALRMASLYPSGLLEDKAKLGRIEKGYQASLVVFDEEMKHCTLLDGF
jgi:N-acetylglucosamine-6-phosphate deacetylase